jgi:hypothetical protein
MEIAAGARRRLQTSFLDSATIANSLASLMGVLHPTGAILSGFVRAVNTKVERELNFSFSDSESTSPTEPVNARVLRSAR